MNGCLVGYADFKETGGNFLFLTEFDIKTHHFFAEPLIPVSRMNADIEEFRFVKYIPEANVTDRFAFLFFL